jgi:hypothetical protein
MTLEGKDARGEELGDQPAMVENIHMDPNSSLRWVRLVETAERSLHWLIPAIVLTYLVCKMIRALEA